MHATIRRYESVDQAHTDELVKKVQDTLLHRLTALPGFKHYSLIDDGNGVVTSVGFFDTSSQADEATSTAFSWVREEKARDGTPEPTADHQRRGPRDRDGPARHGLATPERSRSARGPAVAGLLVSPFGEDLQ
jgi:hypothetical protein